VCLQNGVDNERQALRRFARVYAVPVMCPATHLRPGVVDAHSAPVTGILDVGCYPTGVDDLAETIAGAFTASGFDAVARPDIMRFKWSKLLMNLGNALEAAIGPIGRTSDLYAAARTEAVAVLADASIDCASLEEDLARRGDLISVRPIGDERRGGGSSWQSLARGTGTSEVDQLNGEIVLLGRLAQRGRPADPARRLRPGDTIARQDQPMRQGPSTVARLRIVPAEPAGPVPPDYQRPRTAS